MAGVGPHAMPKAKSTMTTNPMVLIVSSLPRPLCGFPGEVEPFFLAHRTSGLGGKFERRETQARRLCHRASGSPPRPLKILSQQGQLQHKPQKRGNAQETLPHGPPRSCSVPHLSAWATPFPQETTRPRARVSPGSSAGPHPWLIRPLTKKNIFPRSIDKSSGYNRIEIQRAVSSIGRASDS